MLSTYKRSEAPRRYFYWSALAAISAVLKTKIHVDRGGQFDVYPNIYVILYGKSGLRKSFPPNQMRRIASKIEDINVLSGRISIQALVGELHKAKTRESGGGPVKDSSIFVVNEEGSTAFVRDPDALTLLTSLYDTSYHTDEKWKNILKYTGVEVLESPCINMLLALAPEHYEDLISDREVGGGFIARCFIINESKRARKDSLIKKSPKIDIKPLIAGLMEIGKMSGEIIISDKAGQRFDEWYDSFEPEESFDITGTANRVDTQIIKVAMLLAASELSQTIMEPHMEEAMREVLSVASDSIAMAPHATKDPASKKQAAVLISLMRSKNYEMSRTYMLQVNLGNFQNVELDAIIETLEASGFIERDVGVFHGKRDYIYRLTETYMKHWKGEK